MDENTLHEILNEVDLNKNGQVELNEFLQVSCGKRKRVFAFIFWLVIILNGCSAMNSAVHSFVTLL